MRMRRSITLRYRLVTSVLLVICVVLIFSWYHISSLRHIKAQNLEYASDAAASTAMSIEREFERAAMNIQEYARWVSSAVVTPGVLGELEELSVFDGIRFVDMNGYSTASNGVQINAEDRAYYTEGIKGNSGIEVILDSRITNSVVIAFYAPVYHEDIVVGVLSGIYDAEHHLSDILHTTYFGVDASVFLCDGTGALLAASFGGTSLDRVIDTLYSANLIDDAAASTLSSAFETQRDVAFLCDDGFATDNICVVHTSGEFVVVQTFPEEVTEAMLERATKAGFALEIVLLLYFLLYIVALLIFNKSFTSRLVDANRDMGYIISGMTSLYPQFVLLDLEKQMYQYLATDDPPIEKSGPYIDYLHYLQQQLVQEEDMDELQAFFSSVPIFSPHFVVQHEVEMMWHGTSRWEHITVVAIEDNGTRVSKCLVVRQDVSKLKERDQKAQAKLAQLYFREKAYRTAIMSNSICTFDFNLTKDCINTDVIREAGQLSYSMLQRVGLKAPCKASEAFKAWASFVAPEDQQSFLETVSADHFKECFEKGERELFVEYWTTSPTGRHICVRHSFIMTLDTTTEEIFVLVVSRDITKQVQQQKKQLQELQNAVEQAMQASASKSRFLSNMSHDIRTPMNAILGFTQMALKDTGNRTVVESCLNKSLTAGSHLLRLIDDILDVSRIESGRLNMNVDTVSITKTVHDLITVIQPQVKAKKLQLFAYAQDILNEAVKTDGLRLNQVLINILGNAVKYTPAGGSVWFNIRQAQSLVPDHATYIFEVKDNGIGMSEEFVKHIFEPFERESTVTKTGIQGSGLGMSITEHIVKALNGEVTVQSTQGVGSTFTVKLTLEVVEMPPIYNEGFVGKKVLVIDDNPETCVSTCKTLSILGVDGEWDTSPSSGISKVCSGDTTYDAVIADYNMPTMCGLDVVHELKEKAPDLPVIVLTTFDWSEIEETAAVVDAQTFCQKPVFPSTLAEVLARVWGMQEENEVHEEELLHFEGKRILLVEDNELNREIAEELLLEMGFQVESAPDGTDAVRMVKEAPEFYYDAILMDIQMPTMGGYEATQAIRLLPRADVARLPILAMTANALEEDREAAFKHGMNAHLAKPIDIDLFMSNLAKFIKPQ